MKTQLIFCLVLILFSIEAQCQLKVFRYPSPILYKFCENPVILSEVCDKNLEIDYVFEGGEILVSDSNNLHIRLFPTQDSCFLTIFEKKNGQNQFIMQMKCRVVEPPPPSIQLYVNRKGIDWEGGTLELVEGDSLKIEIMPDPEFRANFPAEAQYKPTKNMTKVGAKGRQQEMNNITARWADNQVLWVVPEGSSKSQYSLRLLCVNEIYRINSRGEKIYLDKTAYFEPNKSIFLRFK